MGVYKGELTGILVGVGALRLAPLLAGACVAGGILLGVCACRCAVMRALLWDAAPEQALAAAALDGRGGHAGSPGSAVAALAAERLAFASALQWCRRLAKTSRVMTFTGAQQDGSTLLYWPDLGMGLEGLGVVATGWALLCVCATCHLRGQPWHHVGAWAWPGNTKPLKHAHIDQLQLEGRIWSHAGTSLARFLTCAGRHAEPSQRSMPEGFSTALCVQMT